MALVTNTHATDGSTTANSGTAMAVIRSPRPVNLICGLISNDVDLMARAAQLMSRHFGPIDLTSDVWPFDQTDYYVPEMGEGLQRRFVSFEPTIDPGRLAWIKITTNELESQMTRDCGLPEDRRLVNLDPGYIALSKLVLATTKNGSHRVYLREGIYAESTLNYREGKWAHWPWTYPDYADERYHDFFEQVRSNYRKKLTSDDSLGSNEGGRL
jgi:hypothetical protein